MADALYVIPASVLRNLSDKLYEKRKNAALEVEGIVKQLAAAGDHDKIMAVINLLTTEFTNSSQANHRKGGLIGLAAATVGLSSEAAQHLEIIEKNMERVKRDPPNFPLEMALSSVNFLFSFLVSSIILWLVFMFASRLLAWILSRIMGASVGFRVGGWKCLRDVVVKFKKGAVESVSVGEIRVSLQQSLVKLGTGFISRDPKLQVLISDLEVVMRSSNKTATKSRSQRPRTNCVVNGTREGLDKFLNAASSEPETVLHYGFMQDYKVYLKHLDGHIEEQF
ncbi:Protein SABRE [Camellia lanceoleosa]|uniref:Protein SABRE n=1 Tax=Camellia lanceoleosa TaxID=1840588 RepID=A0ACC0FK99_9ERIC|nr:Protein SABRE [Camellia lanceoleosa]